MNTPFTSCFSTRLVMSSCCARRPIVLEELGFHQSVNVLTSRPLRVIGRLQVPPVLVVSSMAAIGR